jgi:DnaK suppressor protein
MQLGKDDIKRFKKKLLEMRAYYAQIMHNATEDVKSLEWSKGYSQHQADEGTDGFDLSVKLQLTDAEYKIVRQIDRALEKIEENTYGVCDITHEEIPLLRLEAVPYAVMTVKAQEMLEKGLLK